VRTAGVPQAHLLHFYTAVIRPVLYWSMRPQFGITCSRKHKLTTSKPYKGELSGSYTATLTTCLALTHYIVLPSPASQTAENNFHAILKKSVLEPSSCLSTLLPNPRDPSVTTGLRSAKRLPSRTRKYQTFISHAVSHYQTA